MVECKSFYFDGLPLDPLACKEVDKIKRLFEQCENGVEYAMSQGKPYHMAFKSAIPLEFEWLRIELINKGAQIMEIFF